MTLPSGDDATSADAAPLSVERAFGVENRRRLLDRHFVDRQITLGSAWEDIYRLLLWVDRTTGLAHCYESDKCQPGRPWYGRSLAFHAWLTQSFDVLGDGLGDEIDVLFKAATADLAQAAARRRARWLADAEVQRAPYAHLQMPRPGEDSELEAIILEALDPYLTRPVPAEALSNLLGRIQTHAGQENKRKNLVGEGFEDSVAAVLQRVPGVPQRFDIIVRPWLHDIPGFRPPRGGSKARQVDLVLVDRSHGYRRLVSCKWSVRSDREEQFVSDFRDYAELEDQGSDFGYVLLTNEFDPARLAAAAEMRRQNALLFTDVVHVNPAGVMAAYAAPSRRARAAESGGIARATGHIELGRLTSIDAWIGSLLKS